MSAPAIYPVIMAGGGGTRLWPLSTRARPKQLLRLIDRRTLLRATADRLLAVADPSCVFVVTSAEHVAAVREELPEIPPHQVVGEPAGLGTAPAVGLGGALVAARDPGGIVACFPADHIVLPDLGFVRTVQAASSVAAAGHVAVIGVRPTAPDTGFGYIETGPELTGVPGRSVVSFREKPDLDTAREYVAAGGFLWNAGMFIWSAETLLAEYHAHLPALAATLEEVRALAVDPSALAAELPRLWSTVTDRTSVDYGILERSTRVACVEAEFQWHDVGNWNALADVVAADADGNHGVGDFLAVDARDSVVFTDGGTVALLGVSGLIVVRAGDRVLVASRDRAQDVKAVVDALRAAGREDLV